MPHMVAEPRLLLYRTRHRPRSSVRGGSVEPGLMTCTWSSKAVSLRSALAFTSLARPADHAWIPACAFPPALCGREQHPCTQVVLSRSSRSLSRSGYCVLQVCFGTDERGLPVLANEAGRQPTLPGQSRLGLHPRQSSWFGSQISIVTWVSPASQTVEQLGKRRAKNTTSVG